MRGNPGFTRLKEKARRGFKGYPIATVAYYGPDATRASKVVVAITVREDEEPGPLERFISDDTDVRFDPEIADAVVRFIRENKARSIVMADRLIGCPHEEGTDYPEGEVCPRCPYWANRDRWSGDILQ